MSSRPRRRMERRHFRGVRTAYQASQDWYDQFGGTMAEEEADLMGYGNHTASFLNTYYASERTEKVRKKRVMRLMALGRDTTPWAFIKSLQGKATDFFIRITMAETPSWITEEYLEDNLELALHRDVTSWNVQERLVFDKNGSEEERCYIAAEFQASLRWKGKLFSDKWISFDWKNGKFGNLSFTDESLLSDIISEVGEIPEDAGFREESVLD